MGHECLYRDKPGSAPRVPSGPYIGRVARSPILTSTVPRLVAALVLSVLAGVVLAGLAFPVIGGVGLVAKSGADDFLALPADLKTPPLPQRSAILDKDGKTIASLFLENRVPVELKDVPVTAQQALIAIEDSRFYDHNGIDVKGTARALARNSSSGTVQQGGSTLTQQYVKNTLVEAARNRTGQQAARERSVKRKLQEARYALALEHTLTKRQILQGYLNIAYYGNGVYGIGTAANHYFGSSVRQLDLARGALLAGMVQNPKRFDPIANPQAAVARRNVVLARMAELGYITPAQQARAEREGLHLRVTQVASGCEAPGVRAPFFCDYVRRYLEDGPVGAVLGATRQERQEALLAGGLTIHTTLDPVVQAAAQQAVDEQLPASDPFGAAAVVDTVEPGTGAVKAMAVDRGYGAGKNQTKVNLALGGSLGFQGGSTFKAFVLARALQLGIPTSLILNAPATYCPKAFPYVLKDGSCPGNSEPNEAGSFDMATATAESVNTWFIQLEERTGLATPPALAESLGVRVVDGTYDGTQFARTNASFVLGTEGVSPLAMAAAYATFGARGLFCPPQPVSSIVLPNGKKLDLPAQPCSQALEQGVADTLTSLLRGVIDGPDSFRTGIGASIGRPAAGKTGTTQGSRAAWFVGYTPQLATAVWMGKPLPTEMRGQVINGRYYKQVYGGTIPASIWRQTMSQASAGTAPLDFTGADSSVANGHEIDVPDVTGQPVDAASRTLRDQGFAVRIGFSTRAAPIPDGAVAYTYPGAGTTAPVGSTISIHASNGLAPRPVRPVAPSATPQPTSSAAPVPPGATNPPAPAPKPTKKRGGP